MTAIVFGAGGFIGQEVCGAFAADGQEVAGVYHHSAGRVGFQLDLLSDGATDSISEILDEVRPDMIVNCAGTWVGDDDAKRYETGTTQILAAIHRVNRRMLGNVVITGSSSVYGVPDSLPIPETAELRPGNDLYAQAKYQEEWAVEQFIATHKQPVTVARLTNPIGAGMPSKNFLPFLIGHLEAHRQGQTPGLFLPVGQLHAQRGYTHIKDTASGMVGLAEKRDLKHNKHNIGTKTPISNEKLLQELFKIYDIDDEPANVVPQPQTAYADLPLYSSQLEITRITTETGWSPQRSVVEALQEAVAYHRAQMNVA